MIVNIINLPHREDRRISAIQQSTEQGFEIKWWPGIVEYPPAKGISKAHKQIIQYAKDNKFTEVPIMEDDCIFTAPGAFDYFIKNKPKDFDIYFSMIYSGEIKDSRIVNGFSGMTLYIVHERFYDYFLSAPDNDHIDRWLGNSAFEKRYIVCDQYCCYQIGGVSDNHRKRVTYDAYYIGKKWFGQPPPITRPL